MNIFYPLIRTHTLFCLITDKFQFLPCTKQLDLGKSVLIVHVCSKSPELSSFLEIVDRKCLENSRQFY